MLDSKLVTDTNHGAEYNDIAADVIPITEFIHFCFVQTLKKIWVPVGVVKPIDQLRIEQ